MQGQICVLENGQPTYDECQLSTQHASLCDLVPLKFMPEPVNKGAEGPRQAYLELDTY